MARKVLNYGLTYTVRTEAGFTKVDDIFFSKKNMITQYLKLLNNEPCPHTGSTDILGLNAYVWYVGAEEIVFLTDKINNFIKG